MPKGEIVGIVAKCQLSLMAIKRTVSAKEQNREDVVYTNDVNDRLNVKLNGTKPRMVQTTS